VDEVGRSVPKAGPGEGEAGARGSGWRPGSSGPGGVGGKTDRVRVGSGSGRLQILCRWIERPQPGGGGRALQGPSGTSWRPLAGGSGFRAHPPPRCARRFDPPTQEVCDVRRAV